MNGRRVRENFISNMAGCLSKPYTAGTYTFLLEFILMDFELSLAFPASLLSLEKVESIKQIEQSIFNDWIGWMDFQRKMMNLNSTAVIWIVMMILSAYTLFLLYILMFQRSQLEINNPSKTLKTSSILRVSMSLYNQLFVVIQIFGISVFLCKSDLYVKPRVTLNEDLPLTGDDTLNFSSEIKKDFTLNWIYNKNLRCYSGDQLVIVWISMVLLCINTVLKIANSKILTIYPTTLVTDAKRNHSDILCTVLFFVQHIFMNIVVSFRLVAYIDLYYWTNLVCAILQLGVVLHQQPFFNKRLQLFKATKLFLSILIWVWLKLARSGHWIIFEQFLKDSHVIISFSLLITVFTRLVWRYYEPDVLRELNFADGHQLPDDMICELIYEFEKMKVFVSRNGLEYNRNFKCELWTSFKYVKVLSDHYERCLQKDCFCRNRQSFFEKEKYESVLDLPKVQWLLELKLLLARLMEKNILKYFHDRTVNLKNYKKLLVRWAVFTMCNFGNTKSVLTLLHKLKSLNENEPKTNKRNQKNQRLSFLQLLEIDIVQRIVCLGMTNKEAVYFNEPWSQFYLSCSRPVNQEWSRRQSTLVLRAIEYLNSLNALIRRIEKVTDCKRRIIMQLAEGKTAIINLSQDYHQQVVQVEEAFERLKVEDMVRLFKVFLIEVFFVKSLKEDLVKARSLLKASSRAVFTANIVGFFQSDISRKSEFQFHSSVAIGVSGESKDFHTIQHVTSNISKLKFNIDDLLGQDLDLILPYSVQAFHKSLLLPERSISHHLQPGEWLHLSAKSKEGYLKPAEVLFRINHSIARGKR